MNENLIIRIENLKKSFKTEESFLKILDCLNFEFKQGTSYSIQGISGTGKTTLINLIAGLEEPTEGSIFYNKQNINNAGRDLKRKLLQETIGLVFQEAYLLNELTVLENIIIKGLIQNLDKAYCIDFAKELLETVGLKDKADRYPYQLSGGEQQRVSIARALFNKPNFLIADEPTAHLDKSNKQMVVDLLLNFKNKYNIGLIVSTHDPMIANAMDKRLELINGELIQI